MGEVCSKNIASYGPMRVRRGAVAIIFAVTLIPLIIFIGAAVDMARVTMAQAVLQDTVDSAALAGATAYQNDQMVNTAQNVATNYFNSVSQSGGVSISGSGPSVVAAVGYYSPGIPSYNVTVSASATISTTFMSLAKINSLNLSATATAANPQVQPVVTIGPIGSTAADWNSAYMYAIPSDSNGNPKWMSLPPISQFYEIGSNCNSSSTNWSPSSRCNGQYGAVKPANSTFPQVAVTQKLGFMFVNMNNGLSPIWSNGYGQNQWGAQPGSWEILLSAGLGYAGGNYGPSFLTDNSPSLIYQMTGYYPSQPSTSYWKVWSSTNSNCALLVQQVDPNNLPTDPPSNLVGKCYTGWDKQSGSQYANMSCADIAGRTFIYWFNDMGGSVDDYDYKNLYWTLRCTAGSTSPDGGKITGGSLPTGTYTNLGVSLIN